VNAGIARKVDELGRIVLPVEMRRLFGVRPGDEMEISVDGGGIQLRKVEVRCVFCEGDEGLRPYRHKQVCASCASGLCGPTTVN
jgi:transcriptional pleiotropic regulator of transition state genes